MELKEIIGSNIVKFRTRHNMTQQTLAENAEISVSHLRNIEHGRINTTVDTIERLSNCLEVSPRTLVTERKKKD